LNILDDVDVDVC